MPLASFLATELKSLAAAGQVEKRAIKQPPYRIRCPALEVFISPLAYRVSSPRAMLFLFPPTLSFVRLNGGTNGGIIGGLLDVRGEVRHFKYLANLNHIII